MQNLSLQCVDPFSAVMNLPTNPEVSSGDKICAQPLEDKEHPETMIRQRCCAGAPAIVARHDNVLSFARLRLKRLIQEVIRHAAPQTIGELAREWQEQYPLHLALLDALRILDVPAIPSCRIVRNRCERIGRLLAADHLDSMHMRRAAALVGKMIDCEEHPERGLFARARGSKISDETLMRQIAACMADGTCAGFAGG